MRRLLLAVILLVAGCQQPPNPTCGGGVPLGGQPAYTCPPDTFQPFSCAVGTNHVPFSPCP